MRVITPITVSDSNLTSSSIPEPDVSKGEVAWAAGTYNTGDEVIKVSTHLRYRCIAASTTTDDPEIGVLATPPTWAVLGNTNKYKMFDNKNSTQSTDNTNLDVVITPTSLVNSIAGFNIDGASSINVKVNNGVEDIYNRDIAMVDNSERVNWFEFFFSPVIATNRFILTDLPPSTSFDISVSVTGGADISFGNLVMGQFLTLGDTGIDIDLQGIDFSTRTDDGFGGFDVVKRETADLIDYQFIAPASRASYLKKKFKELSQVPTVWVGNDLDVNDAFTVFGYYTDYRMKNNNPSIITTTLQVQELI